MMIVPGSIRHNVYKITHKVSTKFSVRGPLRGKTRSICLGESLLAMSECSRIGTSSVGNEERVMRSLKNDRRGASGSVRKKHAARERKQEKRVENARERPVIEHL
jgi:hypothetical protein